MTMVNFVYVALEIAGEGDGPNTSLVWTAIALLEWILERKMGLGHSPPFPSLQKGAEEVVMAWAPSP